MILVLSKESCDVNTFRICIDRRDKKRKKQVWLRKLKLTILPNILDFLELLF